MLWQRALGSWGLIRLLSPDSTNGEISSVQPPNQQQRVPGASVDQVLSEMPEHERLPMLAYFEQRAKQEGDLEILRDLRAYRAKHNL